MTAPAALPDLGAYRRFVVAFSGGRDSLAALLHLLSLGVPAHAIELHHHDVDGHGPTFMDWPCTPAYVRTIAQHFVDLTVIEGSWFGLIGANGSGKTSLLRALVGRLPIASGSCRIAPDSVSFPACALLFRHPTEVTWGTIVAVFTSSSFVLMLKFTPRHLLITTNGGGNDVDQVSCYQFVFNHSKPSAGQLFTKRQNFALLHDIGTVQH